VAFVGFSFPSCGFLARAIFVFGDSSALSSIAAGLVKAVPVSGGLPRLHAIDANWFQPMIPLQWQKQLIHSSPLFDL